jgi:WD40 repeat protein
VATPRGYFVWGSDGEQLLSGGIARPGNVPPDSRVTYYGSIALSPNGNRLLQGQYSSLELVAVDSRQRLASVNLAPSGTVSVALDPLGRHVAAGSLPPSITAPERTLRPQEQSPADPVRVPVLWDAGSGEPALFLDLSSPAGNAARTSALDPNMAVGVAFSPDGRTFAVTKTAERSGSLSLYSRNENGEFDPGRVVVLPFETMPYFLAFSPDGKLLAVSDDRGDVSLIDVPAIGTESMALVKLRPPATIDAGGPARDSGRLAFSSDSVRLAVAFLEGGVALWDVPTRTQLGSLISVGEAEGVYGVAFAPDGQRLLTANFELNGLVEFDLELRSWIRTACDIAGRVLTPEERRSYELPMDGPNVCPVQ